MSHNERRPIVVGADGSPASAAALLVLASHVGHRLRQIVIPVNEHSTSDET